MSPIRTISSPGIEIREIDQSAYTPPMVGTSVMVAGFMPKGEDLSPVIVPSLTEFETVFGTPDCEAERYCYYAAKEVLQSNGQLVFAKLPYNNTIAANYKYIGVSVAAGTTISGSSLSATSVFQDLTATAAIDSIATVEASLPGNIVTADYDALVGGEVFPSAVTAYDFVIVNENKAKITGPKENEGVFVALVDYVDALRVQQILSNSTEDDVMGAITSLSVGTTAIPSTDIATTLSAAFRYDSFSEDVMSQFPTIEFEDNGDTVSTDQSQYLGVVVCRTMADPNQEGKLIVGIEEAFVGSIHQGERNSATGQTIYLLDIINAGSKYIKMFKNENAVLPTNDGVTSLYVEDVEHELIGFIAADTEKIIEGDALAVNLRKCYEKASNLDEVDIDIVLDAGLTTIAQFTDDDPSGTLYVPTEDVDADDVAITSSSDLSTWKTVASEIDIFCSKIRKDCMAVLDGPRHLAIKGDVKEIRKTAPDNTFYSTIGKKLRYLTGLNSSYSAMYLDWFRAQDSYEGIDFWLPPSVKMAGIYIQNDILGNIWDAPAGLNRGVVRGVFDVAFNPTQKEADLIYPMGFNFAKAYRTDGIVAEGQRTTLVKPSAFDRVNVRRLFLRLERITRQIMRYYVYEPNNVFTRRRVFDALDPIFKQVLIAGGMYDYKIICDESNNTNSVIDRNELKIGIYMSPVKTAEFIIVDFVCQRTGQTTVTENG